MSTALWIPSSAGQPTLTPPELEAPRPPSPTRAALESLRRPFPAEVVGLLPKGPKTPASEWVTCDTCGARMGPHVHLDYIGWAPVVDRILEHDDDWNWEPFALDDAGLPAYRESPNGHEIELWVQLRVLGRTRPGVGVVEKTDADIAKKLVSDALKNAANKFGIALYLWTKDELESLIGNEKVTTRRKPPKGSTSTTQSRTRRAPIQTDPGTAGKTGTTAAERARLLSFYAHRPAPVTDEAKVREMVAGLLDKEDLLSVAQQIG